MALTEVQEKVLVYLKRERRACGTTDVGLNALNESYYGACSRGRKVLLELMQLGQVEWVKGGHYKLKRQCSERKH